jgi:hypothetical protein
VKRPKRLRPCHLVTDRFRKEVTSVLKREHWILPGWLCLCPESSVKAAKASLPGDEGLRCIEEASDSCLEMQLLKVVTQLLCPSQKTSMWRASTRTTPWHCESQVPSHLCVSDSDERFRQGT